MLDPVRDYGASGGPEYRRVARKTGEFIAEVPNYEIADGVVHVFTADRDMYMPLPVFRRAMARAAKALADYDSRKAEVVPMRQRKKS